MDFLKMYKGYHRCDITSYVLSLSSFWLADANGWHVHVWNKGMMGCIMRKNPGGQNLFQRMRWMSSSIEMKWAAILDPGGLLQLLDEKRGAGRPGCGVGAFWLRVVAQGAVSAPWKCKLLLACTLSPLNYWVSCWVPAHSCLSSRRVWDKEAKHASDQNCRYVCTWGR